MADVKIVPLCVGTGPRNKAQLVEDRASEEFEMPFTMFYVRSGGKHIVVDTGIADPSVTQDHHHPLTRTETQEPVVALEALGVGVEEVSIVINTHLHYDHCGSNHLFPNADILVQRRELQYAIAPEPQHVPAYDEIDMAQEGKKSLPNFLRAKLTVVDGDVEVTESVRLLFTPGHTPGSQSVLISGREDYLLAGDNIPLYENIESSEFLPAASYSDFDQYLESIKKSLSVSTSVIPSHDPRVFDQAEFR